jgi:hypothetical protein
MLKTDEQHDQQLSRPYKDGPTAISQQILNEQVSFSQIQISLICSACQSIGF